ncbi:hypothetical protein JG687_00019572 [Phytophthora cactorum]|uniref:Uncharacterized protein n=1 Tax=Phytophthora cactorum TaxID=29920 RepID=A0A8T1TLS6_9STRA|nr:hypothetical protein JG687_00019572 [Phytophthora cactorum]
MLLPLLSSFSRPWTTSKTHQHCLKRSGTSAPLQERRRKKTRLHKVLSNKMILIAT